jgi:RNA polymerase sigma-70 factor (ECF subfamily)
MGAEREDNSTTDGELLARAIAGEPLAVERLLIRYQGRLMARIERKLPLGLRSVIAPEDLLQEAFLEVCRRIRTFKPESPQAFARWLVMIVDSRLIDAVRARESAKRGGAWQAVDPQGGASSATPLLELLYADSHSPSRSVAGHDVEAAIHAAVSGLKADYGEAVRLRFLEGLSISEVATRMGRTEWSVHKLCSRGLAHLREALGDGERFFSRP